jgi:predicted SPOUT superfamily RNA methylase MTH1
MRVLVILPLAMMLVFACGKKGPPRAPELALPETIRDLKAEVKQEGIVLNWSRPMRYVDGSEIRDLAAFVIFRQSIPQVRACPECPIPYRQRVTVSVEDQQKFIKKERFQILDSELEPQTKYRYRIFSRLADGSLSKPSNEVGVDWNP